MTSRYWYARGMKETDARTFLITQLERGALTPSDNPEICAYYPEGATLNLREKPCLHWAPSIVSKKWGIRIDG